MFQVKFMCPRWGFESIPWDEFLSSVKEAGYAGIEWFPFGEDTNYKEVLELLHHYDLDFCIVMTVVQPYTGYENYLAALENDLSRLIEIRDENKTPLFISAQTGREFFTEDETLACIQLCDKIQDKYGVSIYQETHRNKWSFAAHVVGSMLQRYEGIKLTLDVSHWFCVSESYLEDQQKAVNLAIENTQHIHARVGHTQGPQVWNPANIEYAEALNEHLKIWDKCIELAKLNKRKYFTITPEFGPPPYLVKGDRETSMISEQWGLNLWMKNFLTNRYQNF
jgi:sugar phosphate isomerase/epimerase